MVDISRYVPTIISVFIFILIFIVFISSFFPNCDGEKEWSHYTGKLQYIDIDCEWCCHSMSWLKFYNKSRIPIYNCDESLEDIPVNQTYTIYLQPFSEPYAVTRNSWEPSCFWVQVIDYIEDENGTVVWGNKWW